MRKHQNICLLLLSTFMAFMLAPTVAAAQSAKPEVTTHAPARPGADGAVMGVRKTTISPQVKKPLIGAPVVTDSQQQKPRGLSWETWRTVTPDSKSTTHTLRLGPTYVSRSKATSQDARRTEWSAGVELGRRSATMSVEHTNQMPGTRVMVQALTLDKNGRIQKVTGGMKTFGRK